MCELSLTGECEAEGPEFSEEAFSDTYYKFAKDLHDYEETHPDKMENIRNRITEYCL